jgi:sugar lactone lactonase YvrE
MVSLCLRALARAFAIALLGLPATASADVGALTPMGCIADVGDLAGCGATQQGLDTSYGFAVTGDGRHAYATGASDDAVAVFDRDVVTGALTPKGCIADVGDAAGCGATQQGLDGATAVAVSPDGESVYVASTRDDAIARFDRDATTGALTGRGCISDVGDPAGCGATQQGLGQIQALVMSADGESVYTSSNEDDAIARFDRDTTTGALTGQGCITKPGDAADCGATAKGLDGVWGLALTADGKSLYGAGYRDHAIVSFARDPATGALTSQGCVADVGDMAGCGATQQGLQYPEFLAASGDGGSLYAVSYIDSAVVSFARDAATGAISGRGCISDVGDPAGCGATQQGLAAPEAIAMSSDDRSLYVGSSDDLAVVRFDRAPETGALSARGCIADVGDLAGCGATQQGLGGISALALSPDGRSLYSTSYGDDAIVTFSREPAPAPVPDGGGDPVGGGDPSGDPNPGGGDLAPIVPEPDILRPVLSALKLAPGSFAVTSKRPRSSARIGTKVRYVLSEAGTVTFQVHARSVGRRAGGRCVKPSRSNRRAKRCDLPAGASFSRTSRAGSNSLAFSGRLRGRSLAAGRYWLTATPVDGAANRGRSVRAAFRVVSR